MIAVTTIGPTLDAQVDPSFGRCRYLLYVDPATLEFQAEPNDAHQAVGGAGIQTAQAVVNHLVTAVITGSVGPKAISVLQAAAIDLRLGRSGTAREAVEEYRAGQLVDAPVDQQVPAGSGRAVEAPK